MAYAYSTIDNLLKGGNPTPGNANVFSLGENPNPVGNLGQGMTPGGMTGNGSPANPNGVKSDVSGDLSNVVATGSNAGSGSLAGNALSGNQQAAGKALSANTGKVATPGAFGTIGQNLSAATSGLQQQASDYVAGQAANNAQPLSNSVLQNAISGDTGASLQTSDLLSKSAPTSAAAFNPTGLSVPNADLLATNAGIQQIVGQGQAPTYTSGMGAFDTMLLGRDPGFVNQLNTLQSGYRGLQDATKADLTNLPQQALLAQQNALNTAQGQAKTYLGDQSKTLVDSATQKSTTANADLIKALDPKAKAALQKQLLEAQEAQVSNALNALFGNGRSATQLAAAEKGIDASKYINYATQFSPQQFYTPDQALQYNQINSLLRLNTPQVTGSSTAPALYTTDSKGLYDAIYNPAASARYTKDLKDQQIIDQINADAKTRMASAQAQAGNNSIEQNMIDYANKNVIPTTVSGLGAGYNPATIPYGTDPSVLSSFVSNYMKNNPVSAPKFNVSDFYKQNEANLLGTLYADLGTPKEGINVAGKYANGFSPSSEYDQGSFQKALVAAVKNAAGSPMTGIPSMAPDTGIAPGFPGSAGVPYSNPTTQLPQAGTVASPFTNGGQNNVNVNNPNPITAGVQTQRDDGNIFANYVNNQPPDVTNLTPAQYAQKFPNTGPSYDPMKQNQPVPTTQTYDPMKENNPYYSFY